MRRALTLLKRHIQLLYLFFTGLAVFAISLDTVSYPGFVAKYAGIDARILTLITLFLVPFVVRYRKKRLSNVESSLLRINNYILLPLSFILTATLTAIEASMYPNFVFTFFHIHYNLVFFLFIANIATSLAYIDRALLKKKLGVFLFVGSLILIFSGLMIRVWPADAFLIFSKEDGLFENLQVILYLAASLFFMLGAIKSYRQMPAIKTLVLIGLSVMLFFVAGEEISWGQRIFNIEIPKIAMEYNAQKEINLHNIKGITAYQYMYYIVFSFVLLSAWVFEKRLTKKFRILRNLFPKWYLSLFFLPIFVFYVHMNFLNGSRWEWQEFAELMLSLGLFLYAQGQFTQHSRVLRK